MRACRLTIAILGLLLAGGAAHAQQQYPTKPVRLIVPFPAGGQTDIITRTFAQKLTEAFNQPVVVDNRPGAGGTIGAEIAVRASPDGYSLAMVSGSYSANAALYKLPYDPLNDVVPVVMIGEIPNLVTVHPSGPARSVKELIAFAKANPGKLNYGSAGNGTLQHIAIEMMMAAAKFNAVHVPYKGSQAVLVDLLGGQVDFTVDLGASIPHLKSGKLRLLAVPDKRRSPIFPDTPTLIEQGVNVDLVWISGVYAPAGTPGAIVTRLNKEVGRIMHAPEAKAHLDAMAAYAVPAMTPQEFAAHQQRARDRFGAIIRQAGIKAN